MPRKTLSKKSTAELLGTLQARFEKNMVRHPGLAWTAVQSRLEGNDLALRALAEMERTGGEPDVVTLQSSPGEIVFIDCSADTPRDRRNTCYDREGQLKRQKEGLEPQGNVIDMAVAMGIEPLTEEQYLELQKVGEFDVKTQSWLKTPTEIRKQGGAIFAHRRFGRVFVGPNTAPCFYSGRGFRGLLRI